jgi:tRNA (guanine9-N1)-methyltransferase
MVLTFDEAAQKVPRGALSKNEWKRQVKEVIRLSKKEARKGKRERADEQRAAPVAVAGAGESQAKKAKKEKEVKQERDVRIVLDCSFDHLMTDKELVSLSQQVRECYSANRGMARPCRLVVAAPTDSKIRKLLNAHHAHRNWQHFATIDGRFDEAGFPDCRYLSSDGELVLDSVPEGSTLIVGGLVDRNRHKGVTAAVAAEKKVPCYRLPPEAVAGKKPLTTNQVVALVCRFVESGSWAAAATAVVPKKRRRDGNEEGAKEK